MLPSSLPIHLHTGLERSGGATRVARLILAGLGRCGLDTGFSFELAEDPGSVIVRPGEFGGSLPNNAIAHVHCSGDWSALLASIPTGTKTVITLHDCELFTGGCPYPLDCAAAEEGCAGPCPRNFPNADGLRKAKLAEVQRLDPVLVAPSRWLARLAKSHLLRPVTIIPNGIPWPGRAPSRLEARQRLGIVPAAKVALFAAHGVMNAGYKSGDAWLDIWRHLKARLPDLVCFAVGGDTESREGDLVLWPYVDREKLSLLMAAADVLLYPTRADNHPLVVMEAMAQALPVVAYAVGGVPEQIVDNTTGRLVPPGDRQAFIDTAARLLADMGMIRQMSTEAFVSGRKRFAEERMLDAYIHLYERLG